MTTVIWRTPVQFGGGQTLGPGLWSDIGFGLSTAIDNVQSIGIIFDARTEQGLQTTTVGSDTRCLDNPLFESASLVLTLSKSAGAPGNPNITVGLVPDPQPQDYQETAIPNTLLPTTRSEVTLATITGPVPTSPGLSQFTIELDPVLLRAHVTSRARWNGRLALSLSTTVAPVAYTIRNDVSPLTLVSEQGLFFQGLIGGPSGPRQRFVRDGRYGMPAVNTELIRDGDNPSLFVRSFDWDPEDEEATYRPKPGEGTVDDGIPEP